MKLTASACSAERRTREILSETGSEGSNRTESIFAEVDHLGRLGGFEQLLDMLVDFPRQVE